MLRFDSIMGRQGWSASVARNIYFLNIENKAKRPKGEGWLEGIGDQDIRLRESTYYFFLVVDINLQATQPTTRRTLGEEFTML